MAHDDDTVASNVARHLALTKPQAQAPVRPPVEPGQLLVGSDAVVAVDHPVHVLTAPPISDLYHPNSILFAGDKRTGKRHVKAAAASLRLRTSTDADAVRVAPTRLAMFNAKRRIMVRFAPITFNDANETPGTAILLHGLDTSQLTRLRDAIAALPGAKRR